MKKPRYSLRQLRRINLRFIKEHSFQYKNGQITEWEAKRQADSQSHEFYKRSIGK